MKYFNKENYEHMRLSAHFQNPTSSNSTSNTLCTKQRTRIKTAIVTRAPTLWTRHMRLGLDFILAAHQTERNRLCSSNRRKTGRFRYRKPKHKILFRNDSDPARPPLESGHVRQEPWQYRGTSGSCRWSREIRWSRIEIHRVK